MLRWSRRPRLRFSRASTPRLKRARRRSACFRRVRRQGRRSASFSAVSATHFFGWRAVLLVNPPVIAILVVLMLKFLPVMPQPGKGRPLDLVGALLATSSVSALVYGMNLGEQYGFASMITAAMLAFAVVLLIAFIVNERLVKEPMLPLTIFHDRARRGALVGLFMIGCVISAYVYFVSMYMQQVLDSRFVVDGSCDASSDADDHDVVLFARASCGGEIRHTAGALFCAAAVGLRPVLAEPHNGRRDLSRECSSGLAAVRQRDGSGISRNGACDHVGCAGRDARYRRRTAGDRDAGRLGRWSLDFGDDRSGTQRHAGGRSRRRLQPVVSRRLRHCIVGGIGCSDHDQAEVLGVMRVAAAANIDRTKKDGRRGASRLFN